GLLLGLFGFLPDSLLGSTFFGFGLLLQFLRSLRGLRLGALRRRLGGGLRLGARGGHLLEPGLFLERFRRLLRLVRHRASARALGVSRGVARGQVGQLGRRDARPPPLSAHAQRNRHRLGHLDRIADQQRRRFR